MFEFWLEYRYFYWFLIIPILWVAWRIEQYRWELLLFSSTLLFGFYGYYFQSDFVNDTQPLVQLTIISALYNTFRLFLFDVVESFVQINGFVNYPVAIEVSRFTGAVFTISTIIKFLFRMVHKEWQLLIKKWNGNHIVIVGYNSLVKVLVQNLLKEKESLVVIDPNLTEDEVNEWSHPNLSIIKEEFNNASLFKKIGIKNAKTIVFFDKNDGKNIDHYLYTIDRLKTPRQKIDMIVHIQDKNYSTSVEELEQMIASEYQDLRHQFELKIVNAHAILANQILNDFPVFKNHQQQFASPTGKLTILFVGFGQTANHLLVGFIERLHIVNWEGVKFIVLDREANKKQRRWKKQYPEIEGKVNIEFQQYEALEDHLDDYINNPLQPITHAYIGLPDDYENVLISREIAQSSPKVSIYARMKIEQHASEWFKKLNKKHVIDRIGDYRSALNPQYFFNEKLDASAKRMHRYYAESKGYESEDWSELPHFSKESNRTLMNHLDVKLCILGLERCIETNGPDEQYIQSKTEFANWIAPKLDLLAQIEHRRWQIYHFLHDWKVKEPIRGENRKNEDAKLHMLLCDWQDLDEVSEIFNVDYKEENRFMIKIIYPFLKENGYSLKKLEVI